jgi:hypothetical protein
MSNLLSIFLSVPQLIARGRTASRSFPDVVLTATMARQAVAQETDLGHAKTQLPDFCLLLPPPLNNHADQKKRHCFSTIY